MVGSPGCICLWPSNSSIEIHFFSTAPSLDLTVPTSFTVCSTFFPVPRNHFHSSGFLLAAPSAWTLSLQICACVASAQQSGLSAKVTWEDPARDQQIRSDPFLSYFIYTSNVCIFRPEHSLLWPYLSTYLLFILFTVVYLFIVSIQRNWSIGLSPASEQ